MYHCDRLPMDTFLEKSTQSLHSAEFLAKNNFYSSCVNRSYYFFFQFMMHILFEKLKQDKAAYDRECKDMAQSSHIKASNLMYDEIEQKNRKDYIWFQSHVPALRKQR